MKTWMKRKKVELLEETKSLIEYGWVNDVAAKDYKNEPVHPLDAEAIKYSLLGAMQRVHEALNYGGKKRRKKFMEKYGMEKFTSDVAEGLVGKYPAGTDAMLIQSWETDKDRTVKHVLDHLERVLQKAKEEVK